MATYTLAGKLFRATADWPAFRLDEKAKAMDRTAAIEKLDRILGKKYDGQSEIKEMKSTLLYRFDEDRLLFEPAVMASVSTTEGPVEAQLSLIRGEL
jgi:hypothetical protein